MDLGLTGKVALVTGGSHGIGLATSCGLASEGCKIAICARGQDRIAEAVALLKSRSGEALGVQADVLVPEDIDNVVRRVADAWGRVDILINNVGGGGRWGKPSIEDTDDQVWVDVYTKNSMAAARFTRLVIPYMRQAGWGRVVTVASIFGREGGGRPWFNMAKSAEISLMKTLAMTPYLVRDGITFNTVAPGGIWISGTGVETEKEVDPEGFARKLEDLPLGRLGTPEEVASAIIFLCSTQASLINGACIAVDGSESRSF